MPNLFEHFRARVSKTKVKDTNKRAKTQIYLRFSECEYLKPKVKDTTNKLKIKIIRHVSLPKNETKKTP